CVWSRRSPSVWRSDWEWRCCSRPRGRPSRKARRPRPPRPRSGWVDSRARALLYQVATGRGGAQGAARPHGSSVWQGRLQNLQSIAMRDGQEPAVEGLGPAAFIVIVLLGVAVSVLVGQNLRRQRDADIERSTQLYADASSGAITTELGRLYDNLDRRVKHWGSAPAGLEPERGEQAAQLFLRENPATLAIFFADPSWAIVGSPEGKQILRELLPDARRQLADADSEG